jgi:hypothetical protein
MFARGDKRGTILTAVLAVVMLAVAVPTFVMVGCQIGECSGMMNISAQPGSSLSNACGGEWLANSVVPGIVPGEFITVLLTLIAAMVAALAALSPRLELRPVRLARANAPPPPLDPRGERYIR